MLGISAHRTPIGREVLWARRGPAGPQINLLRVVELLQTPIIPALRQAVFGRVRRTERQQAWKITLCRP